MKYRFFENSFSLANIAEWNDLDYSLCNAPSINVFKTKYFEIYTSQF